MISSAAPTAYLDPVCCPDSPIVGAAALTFSKRRKKRQTESEEDEIVLPMPDGPEITERRIR